MIHPIEGSDAFSIQKQKCEKKKHKKKTTIIILYRVITNDDDNGVYLLTIIDPGS